ncbi:hypothetical protein G8A07_25910 [Roseateles sp. DAIF2]|uniref:hypothetical protein n=1 Tax=Roseateles sp. DAIF2 TaxID=2714952 RepID=UPI0018A2601F|nr:hypothetical protein [Roseateles sp. DAIF2]QPF76019.1 hypothetical protein G8A07_25910 [Roseateles sp. DAIF2]
MLDHSYSKTEAGRGEIKARALPLSRSARNLLLVLDASKPARQWLSLVQGVGEPDLAFLLEHGLIAMAGAAAPVAAPLPALADDFGNPPRLGYEQLYAYLSGQGPKQLGLVKGYKFALEVEQCPDLAALQKLALTLVERVQQSKGAEAAAALRQALGLQPRG